MIKIKNLKINWLIVCYLIYIYIVETNLAMQCSFTFKLNDFLIMTPYDLLVKHIDLSFERWLWTVYPNKVLKCVKLTIFKN